MRLWFIVLGLSTVGVGCTETGDPALVYEPDQTSEPDADTSTPADTTSPADTSVPSDTTVPTDTNEPSDTTEPTDIGSDTSTPEPALNYLQNVLPVLRQGSCLGCHSGSRPQGGLNLNTLNSVLAGSQFGPVVKPCKPEESRLVQVLLGTDCEMPPTGSCLSQAHIELVRSWVERGEDLQAHCE